MNVKMVPKAFLRYSAGTSEMEEEKVSTGSSVLDDFLHGGFEKGIITTIYGPGGSGKTTACMLAMTRMAGTGKKIIYVDPESGFSVERLSQITKYAERVLQHTIFFRPKGFEEQKKMVDQIASLITDKIGIIIIDTISMHYRLELSQTTEGYEINSALARQIANLMKDAATHNIPIIVTSQVYADFKDKDRVNIVGGDILKNGSKCLIELHYTNGIRKASLRKHRSIKEYTIDFTITEKGIEKKR